MQQDHDGVETADNGEAVRDAIEAGVYTDPNGDPLALDANGKPITAESEADAESAQAEDEPEQPEDEPTRPGTFEPNDPSMLLGSARDHVLDAIKRSPFWAKLGEKDQRYLANEVEQAQRQVVRGVVRLTASMDLDAVEVTVSKPTLTDKDQIEAKVTCPFDPDTWAAMPTHSKRMLVFASAETLMGARAAVVQKDQPGLFDMGETAEQRAQREAIDAEAAEHEASVERVRQFKPTDDAPSEQGEAAPAPTEAQAGQVAEAKADGRTVDDETGEVYHGGAKPPARAPRGHRGKRVPAAADA